MTAIPAEEETEEESRLFPEEVPESLNVGGHNDVVVGDSNAVARSDHENAVARSDHENAVARSDHENANEGDHNDVIVDDAQITSSTMNEEGMEMPQSLRQSPIKEASTTHEIQAEETSPNHTVASPVKSVPVEAKESQVALPVNPTPSQVIPLTDDDLLQLLEMEEMPPPPTPVQAKARADTDMSEIEAIFSTQTTVQEASVHTEEEAPLQNSLKEERFFFTQNATAPSKGTDTSLLSLDDMSDILGDDMKSLLCCVF